MEWPIYGSDLARGQTADGPSFHMVFRPDKCMGCGSDLACNNSASSASNTAENGIFNDDVNNVQSGPYL